MSVFKRGNIRWYHFVWDGEHIQESTRQGNKRIAEQMEAARKTQLAKREVGIQDLKPVPSFDKAMQRFLAWSEHEHVSHPATYQRYVVSSKALLRYFKDRKLSQVTAETVEDCKELRGNQNVTRNGKTTDKRLRPATVNRELACLKKLFNYHGKSNHQLRNPVSEVKFLPEDNLQNRVLSFTEPRAYLAACSQPLRDVATIMVETGMRPEEVYRMHTQNANPDSNCYLNPSGKTKAARRRIPLSTAAQAIIAARCDEVKDGYLFPSPTDRSKPVRKLNNAHHGALVRSRIAGFRLYDLRHTWATRAAEAGVDLVTLAALLGHSKIDMVLRYAHPTEQHHTDVTRRLEEFNFSRAMLEASVQESQHVN